MISQLLPDLVVWGVPRSISVFLAGLQVLERSIYLKFEAWSTSVHIMARIAYVAEIRRQAQKISRYALISITVLCSNLSLQSSTAVTKCLEGLEHFHMNTRGHGICHNGDLFG